MGKQPPTGFTPSRLYSSDISFCMSARRGSVMLYRLYFSVMALICGWILAIFSDDFMLETRSGSKAMVMTRVRKAIAQPQFGIQCSCVHLSQRNNGLEMKPKVPKSRIP